MRQYKRKRNAILLVISEIHFYKYICIAQDKVLAAYCTRKKKRRGSVESFIAIIASKGVTRALTSHGKLSQWTSAGGPAARNFHRLYYITRERQIPSRIRTEFTDAPAAAGRIIRVFCLLISSLFCGGDDSMGLLLSRHWINCLVSDTPEGQRSVNELAFFMYILRCTRWSFNIM